MPLSDLIDKFFTKIIDVVGDIASTWVKNRIAESPPPAVDHSLRGIPAPAPKIYLLLIKGRVAHARLNLGKQTLALGRLNLDPQDASISHQHAQVFFRDGQYWIADKGSDNGTYLNNARIADAHSLKPGDQILIGHVLLVFSVDPT